MPAVEIPVSEVGEEAGESENPARGEGPPRPRGAGTKRKGRQPGIEGGDGQQRTTERNPIMEHETDDPALGHSTERLGRHAKKVDVVWQELASE